jgi:hypothetical protein
MRGKILIDGARYQPMQLFAAAFKQCFVGRVAA